MNFYDSSYDQHSPEKDWTFDLDYPGKNFWEQCPICCKHHQGLRSGRNGTALCESCWVFMQGMLWFAPMNAIPRPDPAYIMSLKEMKKMQKQLSQ